jgi:hypothetical protein
MGLRRAADRADFLTGRPRSAATGALSNVTVSPGQRLSYRVNILLRRQIALGVEDVIHQHFLHLSSRVTNEVCKDFRSWG